MYKNILLKLSGESLMNESENINKEKTKEIKRIYTGKEIIIAMGKKYQNLHDLYKEHYNEYFELFGDEEEGYIPLTKMPLFDSEEEFYYCLAEGNKDIYRIERLNKILNSQKENLDYRYDVKAYKEYLKEWLKHKDEPEYLENGVLSFFEFWEHDIDYEFEDYNKILKLK